MLEFICPDCGHFDIEFAVCTSCGIDDPAVRSSDTPQR